MNPRSPTFLVMALLVPVFLTPAVALAQESMAGGVRGELLQDLGALEQKYMGLAEAVPAEDYDWRPSEGIRSVGQVFSHVTAANYMFAGMFAEGRPDDVGIENAPRNLEQVTDKEQVLALLRAGFAHTRAAIASTPDSELETAVDMFGSETTVRNVMIQMLAHMHEHLGQSIAYARSNGVTPPWSQ